MRPLRPFQILLIIPVGSLAVDGACLGISAQVSTCSDFSRAAEFVADRPLDAVLISASEASMQPALEFVKTFRSVSYIPVILVTSTSSEELAVEALNAGVNLYLKHPLAPEAVAGPLSRLLRHVPGLADSAESPLAGAEHLIGQSRCLGELREYVRRIARFQSHVLITGETGTGKEVIAELIHRNSPRSSRPFVSLNSTAIPDSLLESELFGYERGAFTGATGMHRGKLALAHTGTIFFDEIGDISAAVQAKLLRAIDGKAIYRLGGEKEIPLDVRILAATNQDLDTAMEQNRFRRDLYYRLNVVRIKIPPLRDRPDDIPPLIDHYVSHFNSAFGLRVEGFTPRALDRLVCYDWPGNVRELKNVLEAIFVNLPGRRVDTAGLPPYISQYIGKPGEPSEREAMLRALTATNWNKTKTADQLHWSRMTLYRKMATYQIARRPAASRVKVAAKAAAS